MSSDFERRLQASELVPVGDSAPWRIPRIIVLPAAVNLSLFAVFYFLSPRITAEEQAYLERWRDAVVSHGPRAHLAGRWVDTAAWKALAIPNLPAGVPAAALTIGIDKLGSPHLLSERQFSWLLAVLYLTFTTVQWLVVGVVLQRLLARRSK